MADPAAIIRDSAELARTCRALARHPYVCVDTEFIRERTYWPVLCLVQLGGPSGLAADAVLVDTLAEGLDLAPLYDLLYDRSVDKVLHAGGQDLEIFHHLGGRVPEPVHDTQVAAAFLGYGPQVGYEVLVRDLAGGSLDKGQRVTDWQRRPLDARQMNYALADVLFLPAIHRALTRRLDQRGRTGWVAEELRALVEPERYSHDPDRAWIRLASRARGSRYLAILRELARWREAEAQRRDVPRQRVLSDAALVEIVKLAPRNPEEMASLRLLRQRGRQWQRDGDAILAAVRQGAACPEDERPVAARASRVTDAQSAILALLRVRLKSLAAEHGIAESMVVRADELERLVQGARDGLPLLTGWRREVFGNHLLRLLQGEVAITIDGQRVVPVELAAGGGRDG